MFGIVYTTSDPASKNTAEYIIKEYGFAETEKYKQKFFFDGRIRIYQVEGTLVNAEVVNDFDIDLIIFLSRHSSASGVPAMTVHSLGNWGTSAKLGGKPKELSPSAPITMLTILNNIAKVNLQIEKTYEATHHGPLLKNPALFAEFGGSEETINDKKIAALLGECVYSSVTQLLDSISLATKVAIGIGGTHYPEKFTNLAVKKGYAFAYMMPKYAVMNDDGSENIDMLSQAFERSDRKPDVAVIDWKSLNSGTRDKVLKKLEEIGLDYEKV